MVGLPRALDTRERVALGLLAVPIVAIAVFLMRFDSSANTTLEVDEPAPNGAIAVVAEDGKGAADADAHPAILTLRSARMDPPIAVQPGRREIQLLLPVRGAACARLRRAIGGACSRVGAASPRAAGALTVEWPGTADVSIAMPGLTSMAVNQPKVSRSSSRTTSWNLRVDSPRAIVELECVEETEFRLVFLGKVLSPRCRLGPGRFTVALPISGTRVPGFSLVGVNFMDLTARGQEATLSIRRGRLFGVSGPPALRGDDLLPVAISSERSRGVKLGVHDDGGGRETDVTVTAPAATGVEAGDDQKLPNAVSELGGQWFLILVLGLAGGAVLSAFLERAPRRR